MAARQPFAGTPGPDAAVFVISMAAELTGLHPQTLRTYERLGLISPERTGGGGRRYSARDIERLREIADLTASGVGLKGVRRIVELESQLAELTQRNEELLAELAAVREALGQAHAGRRREVPTNKLPVLHQTRQAGSVVVWRRGR